MEKKSKKNNINTNTSGVTKIRKLGKLGAQGKYFFFLKRRKEDERGLSLLFSS